MLIEIEGTIHLDGNVVFNKFYKIEDGKDEDMCHLCLDANDKIHMKMSKYIEENCK